MESKVDLWLHVQANIGIHTQMNTQHKRIRQYICKKILHTVFLLNKRLGMVHLPLQIKAFSSVARKPKSTNRYWRYCCMGTPVQRQCLYCKNMSTMSNEGEKNQIWGLQVVYWLSPKPFLILFEQAFCDILGWRSVWKENFEQEVINGLINLLVFIEPLLSAHHGNCKDDDTEFLNLCF